MDLDRKITYRALFMLLVLAVGALGTISAARRSARAAAAVQHSDAVLDALATTLTRVLDVETGARGFVVTGRDEFLEPYESGRAALPLALAQLRSLGADAAHPRQEVDLLARLVDERVAIAERDVVSRRQRGLAATVARLSRGEGKQLNDRIRFVIGDMQDRERRFLRERSADDAAASQRLYLALAAAFGVALLLLALTTLSLRRAIRRPTAALLEGIDRVAAGDLGVYIEPRSRDELGRITAAFNDMVRQRRESEDKLRESEERFRAALDAAPIGMALVALDGRLMRVNDAYCEITGYAREELTRLSFQEITHPEDIDSDVALADKLARGEIPRYQLAKRYLHKDGAVVDVMLSRSVVRDRDGAPLYFIAQLEDITARKRSEEALRRSERQFRGLIEQMPDGVFVNSGMRIAYANRSLATLLGYDDPAELVGLGVPALFHPDDRAIVAERIARLRSGEVVRPRELRLARHDGSWADVETTGIELELELETEVHRAIVVIVRDIAERKRAERQREEDFRRLHAIVDLAPVAIVITTDGGASWAGNVRATEIMGFAFGSGDLERYGDVVLDAHGRPVGVEGLPGVRALHDESVEAVEMAIRRPDGRIVPVLVYAAPIPGEPEQRGAVVAFEDITTIKELERLRSEWSAIIAHDLRQPLASIDMYAQLVAAETATSPALNARVQKIRTLGRRLNRMIQDLLDSSRIEARQLKLSCQRVDLVEIVRAAVERVGLEAPDRRIEVRADGEGVPVDVEVDVDRIAQVMDNLLTNAIKYGDAGTPITVDIERAADSVAVAVTNLGTPIPSELMPHLFGRFQRSAGRERGIKGIGLGLYITRELIEAHHGRVAAESRPDGTTTFRFTLPLAGELSLAPAPMS